MDHLCYFISAPSRFLVVTSAEIAQEVMKTQDLKFANRPKIKALEKLLKGGREIIFSSYGEYWRQMKSTCIVHLLNNKMLNYFEKSREEEITIMMEKFKKASSSSSSVNLSEILPNVTNNLFNRMVLGRKYSSEESSVNIKNTVRAISEIVGSFPVGDYIPSLAWIDRISGIDHKIENVRNTFFEFLDRIIQEHEDKGDDNKDKSDFIDKLLCIQRQNKIGFEIKRDDIKYIVLDMLVAGTATTGTLMEWAMTELIRHPECMKKVQDEIRTHSSPNCYVSEEEVQKMIYLKVVVKEILRIHPPGPILIPRQLSEDVKLNGYDIAAGTQVIINAWAIQRDKTTWGPDAEELKPERHLNSSSSYQGLDFKFIPFGSGRRLCPGIGFALGFAEVALANFLNRFNWKVEARPQGDDDVYDLSEATGLEVCRKFPLIAFPSYVSI